MEFEHHISTSYTFFLKQTRALGGETRIIICSHLKRKKNLIRHPQAHKSHKNRLFFLRKLEYHVTFYLLPSTRLSTRAKKTKRQDTPKKNDWTRLLLVVQTTALAFFSHRRVPLSSLLIVPREISRRRKHHGRRRCRAMGGIHGGKINDDLRRVRC